MNILDKPKELMKKIPFKHRMKDFGLLIVAIVFYAVGTSFFFGPSGLTPGGLSGIAMTLERFDFLPFGKGIIVLILNVPVIILGIRKFGWRFFASTIAAILGSSGLMELLDNFAVPQNYSIDPLPAALGGGVLIGISVGCVLRARATFGGTVCAMLQKGGISLENFSPDILIYSVIAIFVQSHFANMVLYGSDEARMIYIITTKEAEISERINKELHSGVTYLQGKGAYTENDRQILMCAMRKQQLPGAKTIVLQEDPAAFMIVTSASQVLGKGYKSLDEEEL